MNRQEAVIAITKMNRFVKQLNYWCELEADINLQVFGEELFQIDSWANDVHEYLKEYPITSLIGLVEDIGSVIHVKEYLAAKGDEVPIRLKETLSSYVINMEALQQELGILKKKGKGRYANLPTPLANGKAADLLERAVKAGILGKDYQPYEGTSVQKLRVLAFAVSQLMNFNKNHTYVYFDRLWRKVGYRISTIPLSVKNTSKYQDILDLYPEVDFSKLIDTKYEGYVFNSPFDEERKLKLYKELRYQGYIDRSTTKEQFLGIFDTNSFKKPVNWIRNQRQLAYLVKLAFGSTNHRYLWNKAMCCFLVNGEVPIKACFVTGYNALLRSSDFDSYEPSLKAIAESYALEESTEQLKAKIANINNYSNLNCNE